MRMYDVIERKRDGYELTDEEIDFFVTGYVNGSIPDYQASALCMAIFFQGMTARETARLTMDMMHSGDVVDLSPIPGIKVDKHSTGGVGDKTTLAVVPIVASCGVPVAKMSGRGLGHTGGTLDKLESIPGLSVDISRDDFFDIVKTCGCAVVGQTGNLVPADKRLYALRDVTATVNSVPLIASSIMSKKLAAGCDAIVLDVKCGSGAFMKTYDDAVKLAQAMVAIGEEVGRTTVALISDMDQPLGAKVGNTLEVIEACQVLRREAPVDITETCIELAANMLTLAGKGTLEACRTLARTQIANGAAFEKLCQMVEAQGGDTSVLYDYMRFDQATHTRQVRAPRSGFVYAMQTERVGTASAALGAGRETIDADIDFSAGIDLARKTGDAVAAGDVLATLFSSSEKRLDEGERILLSAYDIRDERPAPHRHFLARVDASGVELLG
ncbi:MAG: pyrimidine-nucleoside phosphorylase [Coriobacteriales bacterium]|nr:pyrimidine-nucleoside phosphorylase [Coriobacteriales bacterium]